MWKHLQSPIIFDTFIWIVPSSIPHTSDHPFSIPPVPYTGYGAYREGGFHNFRYEIGIYIC